MAAGQPNPKRGLKRRDTRQMCGKGGCQRCSMKKRNGMGRFARVVEGEVGRWLLELSPPQPWCESLDLGVRSVTISFSTVLVIP